jgi:arylformamidase
MPTDELVDISLPMEHLRLLTYPGDPEFTSESATVAVKGKPNTYSTSILTMSTHAGTHIDPPRHFVLGGAGVDSIGLDVLCGPARVVQFPASVRALSRAVLRERARDLRGVERLLLRTANSRLLPHTRRTDFVALTASGARYLRELGTIRLVGIDYISVEMVNARRPVFPVHNELLRKRPPICIVEGLDLRAAPPGDYALYCLPLKLVGGDGGPARAILVKARG